MNNYVRWRNLEYAKGGIPEFLSEEYVEHAINSTIKGRSAFAEIPNHIKPIILEEISYLSSIIAFQLGFDTEFLNTVSVTFHEDISRKAAFVRRYEEEGNVTYDVVLPIHDVVTLHSSPRSFAAFIRLMAHEFYHIYTHETNREAGSKASSAAKLGGKSYNKNWAEIAAEIYALKFIREYAEAPWNEDPVRREGMLAYAAILEEDILKRLGR